MNRKVVICMAVVMMLVNTFVFIYLDKTLKIEISVYVVQVGLYEKQENADEIKKQLTDNGFEAYQYKNKNIVVVSAILLENDKAEELAKSISEKGMTCVVKEYLVNERLKNEIESKKFDNVYKELK